MKQIIKPDKAAATCKSTACQQCTFCLRVEANKKKSLSAEATTLYDAEVSGYYFHFYQQLMANGTASNFR